MADVRAAVTELLDEHPRLEEPLRTLLTIDAEQETWTFEDVPIDSGVFGEIVSRDIVESVEDEYRLRDPDATRSALAGDAAQSSVISADALPSFSYVLGWRPTIDPRTIGLLSAVLGFLVLMRMVTYSAVFRENHLVSPGNDPYFYRYWIDEFLAESTDWTSTELVANLPSGAAGTRPFTHVANWWIAAVLGGDQWAADITAIWLPVIATLLLGIVIYWTAKIVTNDVRVGIAAVFFLALVPVHAVYSGLGFLEHRLHQYFWLGVTLCALTWLAVDLQRALATTDQHALRTHLRHPRTWVATLALAPALAFSMHAWGGSVLMFVPLAVYAGARAILDVRDGISPTLANSPLLIGAGLGVALTAFLHFRWGWHEPFIAYIPLLGVAGMIAVFLVGELFRVADLPLPAFAGIQVLTVGGGLVVFRTRFTDQWDRLLDRSDDLLAREGATETMSLFDDLATPILQIGLDIVLALAILAWAWYVVWQRYEPAWLALSTYASVWLVFAYFQIRFAAQASIILAVFGGLGLVYLLAWIGLARKPKPFRTDDEGDAWYADTTDDAPAITLPNEPAVVGYMTLILLLFTGFSLLFVPALAGDITYDDDQYEALLAIEDHNATVAEHENFVLSDWGHNRMYNYFVHGEASSYSYAQSTYTDFITDPDPDRRYGDIDGTVGYLVIDDRDGVPSDTAYATLHGEIDDTAQLPDTGHYQAIALGDDASAYAVVPGATITVNGTNASIDTATGVEVDGDTYTYERTLTAASNTTTATTVAYPGEYTIGGETVTVTMPNVINGTAIEIDQ